MPARSPDARGARGAIDKQTGEFVLYTEKPGDGAYPGKYKVTLLYPPKPKRPRAWCRSSTRGPNQLP